MRNLAPWLASRQKEIPERLRACKVSTTLIWGENDQVKSAANAHALADRPPFARLVIVPEAGHNVQQEKPTLVASLIEEGSPRMA